METHLFLIRPYVYYIYVCCYCYHVRAHDTRAPVALAPSSTVMDTRHNLLQIKDQFPLQTPLKTIKYTESLNVTSMSLFMGSRLISKFEFGTESLRTSEIDPDRAGRGSNRIVDPDIDRSRIRPSKGKNGKTKLAATRTSYRLMHELIGGHHPS